MQVLGTKLIGRKILHFETLPSTNDFCRSLAEKNEPEGTVVFSEVQTSGRGRFERKWFSKDPGGLYISVLLRPTFDQKYFTLISLLMAISVISAIKALTGADAYVKQPNDIMMNKKKAGGILTEQKGKAVILGIGININNNKNSFPEDLKDKATSILIETGMEVNKQLFLSEILRRFDREYGLLVEGRYKEAEERIALIIGP
jgi:BirA family biotin operon repressor/biotin-[acetyl-CoA-carboxylase] ligase